MHLAEKAKIGLWIHPLPFLLLMQITKQTRALSIMSNSSINLDAKDSMKALKAFSEYDRRQKDAVIAKTIDILNGQDAPWSEAIIERLSLMSMSDAEKVMVHHPGHKLYIIWQSIENLLPIFKASCDDMRTSLDNFHIMAQDANFFSRRRHEEFEDTCLQVNKCMYHFSSTSVALYNMCQDFRGLFNPPEYITSYEACYTNSNEHHLVKAIRNSLSHKHFAPANYQVSLLQDIHETAFYVQTSALLEYGDLQNSDKRHLLKAGEKIEVRPVFEKHGENVLQFYEWVKARLEEDIRFTDYHRCRMAPKRYATRTWWTIMIQQIEAKKLDPYDHLTNHFTDDELDVIRRLPHRSKEQVDKMIEIYDEDQECNEQMRQRIYKLMGC